MHFTRYSALIAILYSVLFLTCTEAASQVRYVLIVEHLKKNEKPKLYFPGNHIVLHSKISNKLMAGYIKSFTDSTIVFPSSVVLLNDIDYVTKSFNGRKFLKELGTIGAVIGTVVASIGAGLFLSGWASIEDQAAVPSVITVTAATSLCYYAATRKAYPKQFGPETGWRLRMKKIEAVSN
jgi:hypothetical protein